MVATCLRPGFSSVSAVVSDPVTDALAAVCFCYPPLPPTQPISFPHGLIRAAEAFFASAQGKKSVLTTERHRFLFLSRRSLLFPPFGTTIHFLLSPPIFARWNVSYLVERSPDNGASPLSFRFSSRKDFWFSKALFLTSSQLLYAFWFCSIDGVDFRKWREKI